MPPCHTWEHRLFPLQGRELGQPYYVTHPLPQHILDTAQRVCEEHQESVTQQMHLPVLVANVQHAPLCLRVQRQPDDIVNLLAGAFAAVLDMLLNGMSAPQCSAERHEALWTGSRSQL